MTNIHIYSPLADTIIIFICQGLKSSLFFHSMILIAQHLLQCLVEYNAKLVELLF